jgi:hypothetical protein
MSRVTVTPVIGMVSRDRIGSMVGTHALHEKAVTKGFTSPEDIGEVIAAALYEIALADAAGRRRSSIDEVSYLVAFKLD